MNNGAFTLSGYISTATLSSRYMKNLLVNYFPMFPYLDTFLKYSCSLVSYQEKCTKCTDVITFSQILIFLNQTE